MLPGMHNDLAKAVENLREYREKLAESVSEMQAVTASATTKDRMLKVSVDARGRLTEVVFRGNRWRELSPKELGAKVMDVVTRAQEKARTSAISVATGVAPEGLDIRKFMEHGPDLDRMVPDFDETEEVQ